MREALNKKRKRTEGRSPRKSKISAFEAATLRCPKDDDLNKKIERQIGVIYIVADGKEAIDLKKCKSPAYL